MKEKLPPIQFKNPNVQFVLLTNRKPTPFVDIYFGKCLSVLYLLPSVVRGLWWLLVMIHCCR